VDYYIAAPKNWGSDFSFGSPFAQKNRRNAERASPVRIVKQG
jgi:hypothetical protein